MGGGLMVARVVLMIVGMSACGCTCGGDGALTNREGDAAVSPGDPSSKSGYDSIVGHQEFDLSIEEKQALLRLARTSVETWVRSERLVEIPSEVSRFPNLGEQRACFVTLRVHEQLRGCIGSLEPRRSLADDVRRNAVSAAVHDTRFRPVAEQELGSLAYSISVLDLPRALEGVAVEDLPAHMREHRPGVIIEHRGRRSTFLPSVWDELEDPVDFLSRLCLKQGAPRDCWKNPEARISTYGSISFSEKDVS